MSMPAENHDNAGACRKNTRLGGLVKKIFRRRQDPGVRRSIAALVQKAEDTLETPDSLPELDRQERALIANVLRLRDTTADDVMIPRADIVSVPINISLEEALELIQRENHSRMPVYRDQLDNITGMIHVKDLMAYIGSPESFCMQAILRQPLMVAPQMPVLDLLLQMRQHRIHMALVIDEYGGIDGLVTIEDLVETIVGDISDEHDDPETAMITERRDGTFDVDARTKVDQIRDKIGLVLTEEEQNSDIDTIGGLVFQLAGRVPTREEVLTHPSGVVFRVLDTDPRHIRRLRIAPATQPAAVPR